MMLSMRVSRRRKAVPRKRGFPGLRHRRVRMDRVAQARVGRARQHRGLHAGCHRPMGVDPAKESRIAAPISAAWVSSAKWPVSKKRTTASGMSRLNASAPCGRKNGSFLPHTARRIELRRIDGYYLYIERVWKPSRPISTPQSTRSLSTISSRWNRASWTWTSGVRWSPTPACQTSLVPRWSATSNSIRGKVGPTKDTTHAST
jgi:hypothetical protein